MMAERKKSLRDRREFKTLTNLQELCIRAKEIQDDPQIGDIGELARMIRELALEVDNVRQFATGHNHVGPAFLHTDRAWPYA